MEFELNDYHKDISDDLLLTDMMETARRLGQTSLSRNKYRENGTYGARTIERRFGGWLQACRLCGFDEAKNQHSAMPISEDECIRDLQDVSDKLGTRLLTKSLYDQHGKFHFSTMEHRFGSWNKALIAAGLDITRNVEFSEKDLFQEIERIWILLGRQPTTTDLKRGISKYSLNSYNRRFGGWRGALEAFVEWVNHEENATHYALPLDKSISCPPSEKVAKAITHTTPRDVNLRLRFLVMQRDNFKCCICGASPAKDPSIELHIDHIIPWSKGGETTIENLQTLCSRCNLGKSNLLEDREKTL